MRSGADEMLLHADQGDERRYWEGSRTNLFVVRAGALHTPPLSGPVLPGVMRAVVQEWAVRLGIPTHDDLIRTADVPLVSEAFLTNSGRGIWPVSHLLDRALPAPGPLTARLRGAILRWLQSGGDSP